MAAMAIWVSEKTGARIRDWYSILLYEQGWRDLLQRWWLLEKPV